MRLIDADALKAVLMETTCNPGTIGEVVTKIFCRRIDDAPEAIVRCKDCKYCKVYDDIPWCNRLTGTFRVEEESFCSFGRKENR